MKNLLKNQAFKIGHLKNDLPTDTLQLSALPVSNAGMDCIPDY